jgi:competence protein ComEA
VPPPTRATASSQRKAKPSPGKSGPAKPTPGGKIDINRASAQELEALPGIGPVLAQRIVTYRQEHGPFASVEDLKLVSGIGDAIFARVRDFIVVH